MGNMLYQSSDNMDIVKGDNTARYSNAATTKSLNSSKDLTKSLLNYKNVGGCGCK
jgi:hypothetical protein